MKKIIFFLIFSLMVNPVWGGIYFDGVDNDVITIGSIGTMTSNTITIAFWIKADVASADATQGPAVRKVGSGAFNWGHNTAAREQSFEWANNPWPYIAVTTEMVADVWYHFAGVFKHNTYIKTYLDGARAGTNASPGSMVAGAGAFHIANDEASYHWDGGIITDVAFWTTELTATEIAFLASSRTKRLPLQIQPSSLVGYWPLDEVADGASGDGVTFKDLSGTGNDGTGDDGANNTGLTGKPETVVSYP